MMHTSDDLLARRVHRTLGFGTYAIRVSEDPVLVERIRTIRDMQFRIACEVEVAHAPDLT